MIFKNFKSQLMSVCCLLCKHIHCMDDHIVQNLALEIKTKRFCYIFWFFWCVNRNSSNQFNVFNIAAMIICLSFYSADQTLHAVSTNLSVVYLTNIILIFIELIYICLRIFWIPKRDETFYVQLSRLLDGSSHCDDPLMIRSFD